MRFATYLDGTSPVATVLTDGRPVRFEAVLGALGRTPADGCERSEMRRLLELDQAIHPELSQAAAELAARGREEDLVDTAAMTLGTPIPDPEKIICVGANYQDHVEEAGLERPETPVLFAKFANSLIASGEPIAIPGASDEIDWEGELAVVIGAGGRGLDPDRALEAVAGYTVFNDVSARDLQLQSSQWLPGKAVDTFGPCGPWLVSADEVPDPGDLRIETRLNGEVVQSGSTGDMIFGIEELLVFISSVMTLAPGDIIATGTPAGVGCFREPPVFLAAGDEIGVQIERVGEIRNPVVRGAD